VENSRQEEPTAGSAVSQPPKAEGQVDHGGLEETLLRLLAFQAQQGVDQSYTMIMMSLTNLLGIVNCMNRVLPRGEMTREAGSMANQIASLLGVPGNPAVPGCNNQGAPPRGGIDPALLAALAGMLGGPRGPAGPGEAGGRGGIDPAMLAALAGIMGSPGGPNPAALMGLLANMMAPPMRPPEAQKPREEKSPEPQEKVAPVKEVPKKEPFPQPKGGLRWDPRLG